MVWHKGETVTLTIKNIKSYFKAEKPSADLLDGYRDGVFDVLRLVHEICEDESSQTCDQLRRALLNMRKERQQLLCEIDIIEEKRSESKNLKSAL